MREWHVVIAAGFVLGWLARAALSAWRRRARSDVYKGRWPVVVFALSAGVSAQACSPVALIGVGMSALSVGAEAVHAAKVIDAASRPAPPKPLLMVGAFDYRTSELALVGVVEASSGREALRVCNWTDAPRIWRIAIYEATREEAARWAEIKRCIWASPARFEHGGGIDHD